MTIYNVLVKDRHSDPEIHNFTLRDVAIDFAREIAQQSCHHEEDYIETNYENGKNATDWILLIEYSREGDYVRVSKGELR